MLPFLTGSTLKRQYNKTTQLESTLVQNPYISDITYVPTKKTGDSLNQRQQINSMKWKFVLFDESQYVMVNISALFYIPGTQDEKKSLNIHFM